MKNIGPCLIITKEILKYHDSAGFSCRDAECCVACNFCKKSEQTFYHSFNFDEESNKQKETTLVQILEKCLHVKLRLHNLSDLGILLTVQL